MLASCPHRPPCTACPRFGEPGLAPAARIGLQTLAAAHGLSAFETVDGPLDGFRLRARLAIRGRQNVPKLGLFEAGTHRVVHIPRCSIQHPLINRAADVVRRALVESKTTCYSDTAQAGVARYLQVVVERQSQSAQVVVVANAPVDQPPAQLLACIREYLGERLHSLWFNSNQAAGNVILGASFTRWSGPATISERFGGAAIHYGPGAFGQSNLTMAAQIIARIRGELTQPTTIADFYSGVGAIGLSLMDRAQRLYMNEVSPAGLEGLQRGIAGLSEDEQKRVQVFPGSAGEACAAAADCEVVIVDPPRKGLDAGLLKHLVTTPPRRVFYVSCGLASLAGDAAALTASGHLRLHALTAFNQFPFTEHVETLALFERS